MTIRARSGALRDRDRVAYAIGLHPRKVAVRLRPEYRSRAVAGTITNWRHFSRVPFPSCPERGVSSPPPALEVLGLSAVRFGDLPPKGLQLQCVFPSAPSPSPQRSERRSGVQAVSGSCRLIVGREVRVTMSGQMRPAASARAAAPSRELWFRRNHQYSARR